MGQEAVAAAALGFLSVCRARASDLSHHTMWTMGHVSQTPLGRRIANLMMRTSLCYFVDDLPSFPAATNHPKGKLHVARGINAEGRWRRVVKFRGATTSSGQFN